MSPLYKVLRSDVTVGDKTHEWQPIDVSELGDGSHIIEGNGVRVPITIEGNKVTVHLSRAVGDLYNATVAGMGDDWTVGDRETIEDVVLNAEKAITPLHIFSDGELGKPAILVEKHDEAPEVFDLSRRK